MALFSFLTDRRDARSSSNPRVSGAQPLSSVGVEEVRARARRRLIGAAVLVMTAVIGLPLVFESKPRSVAVDTPIEVARPDGLPAVSVPAAKPVVTDAPPVVVPAGPDAPPRTRPPAASQPMITEATADAGREVPPPPAARASMGQPAEVAKAPSPDAIKPTPPAEATKRAEAPTTSKTKPIPKPSEASDGAPKPAASKSPAPKAVAGKPTADEAQRARALLEGESVDETKAVKSARTARPVPPEVERASAGGTKFGVQVGAFAQSSSADAAIGKVAALGLKAHAQEIDTPNGKRIRVRLGPYATREEADRAAQRLRAGGQTAAVVTQ